MTEQTKPMSDEQIIDWLDKRTHIMPKQFFFGSVVRFEDALEALRLAREPQLVSVEITEAADFGIRLAKALLDSSSSTAYFFVQQAYGDDVEWDAVKERLDRIRKLPLPTPPKPQQ